MEINAKAKKEFEFSCIQIELRIDVRMGTHELILMGADGPFDASSMVTNHNKN